jgi:hypothetical protein
MEENEIKIVCICIVIMYFLCSYDNYFAHFVVTICWWFCLHHQPLQCQLYLFQKSAFRLVISYFFSEFLLQAPLDIIIMTTTNLYR